MLAGYSLGQADLLRRAMGKKKKEVLDKEFVPFRDGMPRARLLRTTAIQALWDMLVPFADYAFNKAHTAAYGLVSYWTAYLKANYPAEYMAALLTSVERRQGQDGGLPQRVPPDGHQGAAARRQRVRRRTSPRGATRTIRVRPGRGPQRRRERGRRDRPRRKEKGEYADFPDFLSKVDAVVCNKRAVESLIKAGAFDALGHTRKGLVAAHEPMVDTVVGGQAERGRGPVRPLRRHGRRRRDADPPSASTWRSPTTSGTRPTCSPWSARCSACTSPTTRSSASSTSSATRPTPRSPRSPATSTPDGPIVTVGGIISGLQRRVTKQGDAWAIATVEDLAGSHRLHVLPRDVPAGVQPARRGRDRLRQGPARQARGRAPADRDGGRRAGLERSATPRCASTCSRRTSARGPSSS